MDIEQRAASFEATTPWLRNQDFSAACLQDLSEDRRTRRVLDVGGGTGALGSLFTTPNVGAAVDVVDVSAAMLARVPPGCARVLSSFETYRASHLYDTILLRQFLHYVEDPKYVLRRARAMMTEEGLLYIGQLVAPTNRSAAWMQEVMSMLSGQRRRMFTETELRDLAATADLGIVKTRRFAYRESLGNWAARVGEPDFLAKYRLSGISPDEGVLADLRASSDLEVSLTWLHLVTGPLRE